MYLHAGKEALLVRIVHFFPDHFLPETGDEPGVQQVVRRGIGSTCMSVSSGPGA
jgi:hypothetical protein